MSTQDIACKTSSGISTKRHGLASTKEPSFHQPALRQVIIRVFTTQCVLVSLLSPLPSLSTAPRHLRPLLGASNLKYLAGQGCGQVQHGWLRPISPREASSEYNIKEEASPLPSTSITLFLRLPTPLSEGIGNELEATSGRRHPLADRRTAPPPG